MAAELIVAPEAERRHMAKLTLEGIVKNGQIRLADDVKLPEHTKGYVVIPNSENARQARFHSPRLRYPAQAADFAKSITEVPADAE